MPMMKAITVKDGTTTADALVLGEAEKPEPENRELLIKVHYTAINRADTLQRKGKYPVPAGESLVLGLECSGEVVGIADGCEGDFKVGDKVMALLGGGGYAQYAVADERSVMRTDSLGDDMLKAAAIPETWLTAYQLLHLVGSVKKGDNVIVHAAGSGVGLAACQLAALAGATPIATARTASKLEAARAMGAVITVDTKEHAELWATKVLEATDGKGADLILDPVGGSYSQGNADALAKDGTWVSYGLMGGAEMQASAVMGVLLRKRATLRGTTLRSRTLEYKGELVSAFSQAALGLFATGGLQPAIDKVFPLGEAAQAHAFMEANGNTGKIMLKVL